MKSYNIFTCFHINTHYSSVPKNLVPLLIRNCYHPLLNLAESGFRIAIELTGESLEDIAAYDSQWIDRFKKAIAEKKCELVGSSYAQCVFPLIPALVNEHNLRLGLEIYKKILNHRPRVAYANEQTFSTGIVDLYDQAGYAAVIMDWNNMQKSTQAACPPYTPVIIASENKSIPIIWNNSIAFQKLQRHVIHQEVDLEKYLQDIISQIDSSEGALCVYGSDAEVFGFRPWNQIDNEDHSEDWKRIQKVFTGFKAKGAHSIFPSQVLQKNKPWQKIKLTDPAYPIPTKKQDKYNLVRWAVTGRDDTMLNTKCYQFYKQLTSSTVEATLSKKHREQAWKLLCKLWRSDLRTHTTEDHIQEAYETIGRLAHLLDTPSAYSGFYSRADGFKKQNPLKNLVSFSTPSVSIELNTQRGGAISKAIFPKIHPQPLFGTLPFGHFFDDISYSPDFYSGHIVIVDQEGNQRCDLEPVKSMFIHESKETTSIIFFITTSFGLVEKKMCLYAAKPQIDLTYRIRIQNFMPRSFRLGMVTFFPNVFDPQTLRYTTKNGGYQEERYNLHHSQIMHHAPIKTNISARHCLGATDGKLDVSDDKKGLTLFFNPDILYSVPLIHYEQFENGSLFRIYSSIAETDETSMKIWRGVIEKKFTFQAHL